jgi:hypothetical protein
MVCNWISAGNKEKFGFGVDSDCDRVSCLGLKMLFDGNFDDMTRVVAILTFRPFK